MAEIFNAKYNSLPEQVQKNKEDIEELSSKIVLNPRGVWNSVNTYSKGDYVSYNYKGYVYVSDTASTNTPPGSGAYILE